MKPKTKGKATKAPAKPAKGFALVYDGEIKGWSFEFYRSNCVREAKLNFGRSWDEMKACGYRIAKVEVREVASTKGSRK